jgi:hypothetical protein
VNLPVIVRHMNDALVAILDMEEMVTSPACRPHRSGISYPVHCSRSSPRPHCLGSKLRAAFNGSTGFVMKTAINREAATTAAMKVPAAGAVLAEVQTFTMRFC